MPTWIQRLGQRAFWEVVWQALWQSAPIWGSGVVTALLGWESVPWAYLYALMVFVAAMAALCLNQWTRWRRATTANGKIAPGQALIGQKENQDGQLEGVGIGLRILNHADFPIELQLESMDVTLANLHPTEQFPAHSVVIPAKSGFAQVMRAPIDVTGLDRANRTILGTMKVVGKYGPVGKPKFPFLRDVNIAVRFDGDGNYMRHEQSLLPMTVDQ